MDDTQKVKISSTAKYVRIAGIIYGIVILVFVFPMAVFTFGQNNAF